MRIREIAQTRVRYGYRKILVLLNREGWKVGKTLVQRLYQEEGLVLNTGRNAGGERRSVGQNDCARRRRTRPGVWIMWRTN